MTSYLAATCPQCSKWIPLRECEPEDPTFDPTLLMQLTCPHCGGSVKLSASVLEVISESELKAS